MKINTNRTSPVEAGEFNYGETFISDDSVWLVINPYPGMMQKQDGNVWVVNLADGETGYYFPSDTVYPVTFEAVKVN